MKIACVIPARLRSSRFPKKILASLKQKPVIQWVWEAALKTEMFDQVVFAIDSEETAACVESFGGEYYMTDERCMSGTERLVELQARKLVDADIWVNWQGDEPFLHKGLILDLLQSCGKEESDIWTLRRRCTAQAEIHNPHIAKVVCDAKGYALYFSRSTIPYYRDPRSEEDKKYFKHIGVYAYTADALRKISLLPPFDLEEAEQLEQLRFLAHGLKIRVHDTEFEGFGIDLPEHLTQAELFADKLPVFG